jgi:hypothetical protein
MMDNHAHAKKRPLDWDRVGQIVLWALTGEIEQRGDGPDLPADCGGAVILVNEAGEPIIAPPSRGAPCRGAPIRWDVLADVRGLCVRCHDFRAVAERWALRHRLDALMNSEIPEAEKAHAWAQRTKRHPQAIGRARNSVFRARARRRVLESELKTATRSPEYNRGMEWLARELSRRGIQ